MTDIGNLLEGLKEEGWLDSAGRFTLNFRDASAPLEKFLEEHPAWPWLRLVQMVHQQRVDYLRIGTGKDTFLCKFQLSHGAQDWMRAGYWLQGRDATPPPSAVADVLLGLAASRALRWQLTALTESQEAWINWSPETGIACGGEIGEAADICLQTVFPRQGWFRLGRSRVGAVHANLTQRCRFSPIPIEIDGQICNEPDWWRLPNLKVTASDTTSSYRQVADSLHWDEAPYQTQFAARPVRALRYLGQRESSNVTSNLDSLVVALEPPSSPQNPWPEGWALPHLQNQERKWIGLRHRIVFPPGNSGDGQLVLIRDGVVTDPAFCDFAYPGLIALTSDSSLKSDASSLQIIQDRAFEDLCKKLREKAKPMGYAIVGTLDDPRSIPQGSLAESLRYEWLSRFRA